ncbi:MAG: hypothetical protein JWP11_1304 [Frankiales bacterium]|nr:hypothetical protein [Frankiales bacterium]
MPLDLEQDVAGNVAVHVDGAGRAQARIVSADLPCATHEHLHLPHFATCGKPASTKGQVVVPIYKARAKRQR